MEITEIARDEKQAYGISFVVCTSHEVTTYFLGIDGDVYAAKMAAFHAQLNAMKAIDDAGFDFETEPSFKKYNGGPYSRFVHLCWYTADIVESEGFDEDEQHLITPDDTRDEWKRELMVNAGTSGVPEHVVKGAEAIQDDVEQKARCEAARMLEFLK